MLHVLVVDFLDGPINVNLVFVQIFFTLKVGGVQADCVIDLLIAYHVSPSLPLPQGLLLLNPVSHIERHCDLALGGVKLGMLLLDDLTQVSAAAIFEMVADAAHA